MLKAKHTRAVDVERVELLEVWPYVLLGHQVEFDQHAHHELAAVDARAVRIQRPDELGVESALEHLGALQLGRAVDVQRVDLLDQ